MKERCRHSSVGRSEELSVRGSASVLYILDFDLFFLPTKLNTHGSSVVAHRCARASISLLGYQLPPTLMPLVLQTLYLANNYMLWFRPCLDPYSLLLAEYSTNNYFTS